MIYQDLLGRPWRSPDASEPADGLDCLDAVLEVLRRSGREVPTREGVVRGELAMTKLGTSVAAAERVGDVIYTEPKDGKAACVYVLVEPSQGRALTSLHDQGVSLVRLSAIPEPLTVWRCA